MHIINQEYELVPVASLTPHPRNPRKGDTPAIAKSITHNGFYGAVVAQRSTGFILAGNHRLKAAVSTGAAEVPVIWVDCDDERALRILLADNRTNDLAGYDEAALAELLGSLPSLEGTGYDQAAVDELVAGLGGAGTEGQGDMPTLSERFLVPPFSVLDARQGYWQARKREWLSLGIQSELGRGGGHLAGVPGRQPN